MRQLNPVILVTAAAAELEDRALFAVDATDSDGAEGSHRWIDHPARGRRNQRRPSGIWWCRRHRQSDNEDDDLNFNAVSDKQVPE